MMNQFLRTTAVAALAAAAFTVPAQAADVESIAILVPEQGTDYGWNQQGVDAARAAGEATGVEVIAAEGLGYGDVRPTLRELAAEGVDLMIAHASGYNTSAPEIAEETGVPVAIVDRPDALEQGLIAGLHPLRPRRRLSRRPDGGDDDPDRHGRHRRLRRAAVLEQPVRRLRPGGQGREPGRGDPLRRDRPGGLIPTRRAASA